MMVAFMECRSKEAVPIAWCRAWAWRFIERVDVTMVRPGRFELAIAFKDGSKEREVLTTWTPVTEEEMDLARRLWQDPERPARGWCA